MSYWMAVRRRLMAIALAGIDVAALVIAYTGAMTDQIVAMGDGKQYRLLTLTSSGTLTVEKPVQADVWMCGGGSNHGNYANDQFDGGGGGFVSSGYNITLSESMTAVVGAAEGASSFAAITASGSSTSDGGSGGGAWRGGHAGTGANVTTYPFGDTTYFAGKPHSAGGAAGGYDRGSREESDGGNGGSNGSGGSSIPAGTGSGRGGNGGTYGGGNGGSNYGSARNGGNATFYGGGSGGAASYWDDDAYNPDDDDWTGDQVSGTRGAGYQGVIYVRISLDQKAA